MQIKNSNNQNVTNNIYYVQGARPGKAQRKQQEQGMGCAVLLVILVIAAAITYWRITVPILILAAVAAGAWYARRRRKRLDEAERATGLREFPVGTVLYELDGTMVQVGEIAPSGGRLVRLRDFAGPETVMSLDYLRSLTPSRPA